MRSVETFEVTDGPLERLSIEMGDGAALAGGAEKTGREGVSTGTVRACGRIAGIGGLWEVVTGPTAMAATATEDVLLASGAGIGSEEGRRGDAASMDSSFDGDGEAAGMSGFMPNRPAF